MRALGRIAMLLAIYLAFEVAISWLAFCHPYDQQTAYYETYYEYCALRGPFVGVISWGWGWLITILHDRDKEIVAAFTVILTLSTVALWISTKRLWQTTKDAAETQARDMEASIKAANASAKAAERAADASERALIAADRPWVDLRVQITGDLKFGDDRIELPIHVTFKNIGKSPALNVAVNIALLPDFAVAMTKADASATQVRRMPLVAGLHPGISMFPGDERGFDDILSLDRSAFAGRIAALNEDVAPEDRVTTLRPAVLGFAFYRLPASRASDGYRCTSLLLEVGCSLLPLGFDGTEGTVAKDNFELVPTMYGGPTT